MTVMNFEDLIKNNKSYIVAKDCGGRRVALYIDNNYKNNPVQVIDVMLLDCKNKRKEKLGSYYVELFILPPLEPVKFPLYDVHIYDKQCVELYNHLKTIGFYAITIPTKKDGKWYNIKDPYGKDCMFAFLHKTFIKWYETLHYSFERTKNYNTDKQIKFIGKKIIGGQYEIKQKKKNCD